MISNVAMNPNTNFKGRGQTLSLTGASIQHGSLDPVKFLRELQGNIPHLQNEGKHTVKITPDGIKVHKTPDGDTLLFRNHETGQAVAVKEHGGETTIQDLKANEVRRASMYKGLEEDRGFRAQFETVLSGLLGK